MEIIEILHPLGPVQVNHFSEWKESGPYMVAANCSVYPGGVVNIILYPSDDMFGADSKQQLAIVKTKKATIAVSKDVLEKADKTAVKDKAYTGVQPPSQAPSQTPPAAEKPKDYATAPAPLEVGEYNKRVFILEVKPMTNRDGVHMSNEYQGKVSWKYTVTYALDNFKRSAIWESQSSTDPMIKSGEMDVVLKVTMGKIGSPFTTMKKPRTGGGFGGGSAPADPRLTLLAGIVSNSAIPPAQWADNLKNALKILESK